MSDPSLYWTKVAAIGQVAGACATFLAVLTSLYIAFLSRKPRLQLTVGKRIILGEGIDYPPALMFEVANQSDRPVQIRTLGWRTGWSRWAIKPLKSMAAVQMTGGALPWGADPPYELQPGMAISSYATMENVIHHARQRTDKPLFTRDWPVFGRRATRIRVFAHTADGFTIVVKPESDLAKALVEAEKQAKEVNI